MLFTLVDWVIIIVIIFSTLISLWRGAAREVLSLLTWLVAIWVAFTYYTALEPALVPYVEAPELRMAITFTILLVAVVIVGTIIAKVVSTAINSVGLSGLDRILGLGFGCLRGVLILAIFVLLAGFTELPSEPWWKDSTLIPHLKVVGTYLMDWLGQQGFEPFKTEPTNGIMQDYSESP